MENTRLRVTVGGEEIVVKEQVRKLVHTILSAKDYIGWIVSAEPHAALASLRSRPCRHYLMEATFHWQDRIQAISPNQARRLTACQSTPLQPPYVHSI